MQVTSPWEIANPMPVKETPFTIVDVAGKQWLAELQLAHKDAKVLQRQEVAAYANRLVETAKEFAVNPIDCLIVPYRGGLTPSMPLQVMNKLQYPTIPLGFSRGSDEKHWPAIRDELIERLGHYRDRPQLAIGVIDTAIRGDSALALAHVLRMTKEIFNQQKWTVTFHLLHATDRHKTPLLTWGIPGLSTGELVFDVRLHQVPSLLVDDWDEGLGLKVEWKEGRCIYKACASGQVIVQQSDESIAVIEAEALHRFITEDLSKAATEAITTDPSLRLKYVAPGT